MKRLLAEKELDNDMLWARWRSRGGCSPREGAPTFTNSLIGSARIGLPKGTEPIRSSSS